MTYYIGVGALVVAVVGAFEGEAEEPLTENQSQRGCKHEEGPMLP
jgi:hypothetical protein